jgi:16S rRNA (uracil1498-N3)-methyltransferase
MRVSRIFQAMPLQCGDQIVLDEDGSHYVRTVLRLKKESNIIVFNGQGGEFLGNILESSRQRVTIDILEWIDKNVESNLKVFLGLSISKGSRMDYAIQKAVELGVHTIMPLISERTVVKLTKEKQSQKIEHWQKIANHAAEQCGRTMVPVIHDVQLLFKWIDKQSGTKIFLDPNSTVKLSSLVPKQPKVTLLSGPEGGFSQQERRMVSSSGFNSVQLGKRILRSETVAVAALAAVQTIWGDYG